MTARNRVKTGCCKRTRVPDWRTPVLAAAVKRLQELNALGSTYRVP